MGKLFLFSLFLFVPNFYIFGTYIHFCDKLNGFIDKELTKLYREARVAILLDKNEPETEIGQTHIGSKGYYIVSYKRKARIMSGVHEGEACWMWYDRIKFGNGHVSDIVDGSEEVII